MIEALAFAKKAWPLFVIVALVFIILFQRNTISRRDGEISVARVENGQLKASNAAYVKSLQTIGQRQVDNDAIAEAVAAKLNGNSVREVHTREVIERLKANDPVVRDWANQPVPSGVREALRTR